MSAWQPDFEWLESLITNYPECWIKNEWWEEERRIKRGTNVTTISEKSEREFRSELRTEIRRYVKDTQRILKGVSQGKYRKMLSL